jgi:uncharacterized protein YjbJ (UPF0337 family)
LPIGQMYTKACTFSTGVLGIYVTTPYKITKEEETMPSRSSREDKNEGAMDRAKGRMKEAGGALTGDKSKKQEGRLDQRKGRAKEKKGNLKDLLS